MIAWLRKRHWLHDWTKWEQCEAKFTSVFERGGYFKLIQIRNCKGCGLMQHKSI